jgi:ferredoxin-thioredoxin reductase catalytic subunit
VQREIYLIVLFETNNKQNKMKKQTQLWLKQAGYQSSYSGNTKTLYVHGISQKQLDYFGLACPFKLVAD